MADPRLGYRDGSGIITTQPTQYADGSTFDATANPTPNRYWFDYNNFAVIPPGSVTLTASQLSTLSGISGAASTADFSDYPNLLRSVGTSTPETAVIKLDDFVGDLLADEWGNDVDGGTVAISSAAGEHAVLLSTGTVAANHATLIQDIDWSVGVELLLVEARVKLSHITEIVFEFGFSDALSETSGLAFSSHDATPVAVASNAAVIAFHNAGAGDSESVFSCVSVNADTAARNASTTTATADTFYKLSVGIDASGNAGFYIDGSLVATQENAVATTANLSPWVSIVTQDTTEKIANVDYVLVASTRT